MLVRSVDKPVKQRLGKERRSFREGSGVVGNRFKGLQPIVSSFPLAMAGKGKNTGNQNLPHSTHPFPQRGDREWNQCLMLP